MTNGNASSELKTWTIETAVDPDYKIDFPTVRKRTKRMIAFDKNIAISEVTVEKTLSSDLMYSDQDKADLKGLIDNIFFRDVGAVAKVSDLVKATTIADLILRIYTKYIPQEKLS